MLYIVQTGSFKTVKTAEDGYEHVLAFSRQRDLIGYDGLYREHYVFAAVALEYSRVVALPMAGLAALRQRSPALDAALQALIARQLAHAGEIAEVMSAVAADARLARFLVQLSAPMAERGQSPRRLLLRMNRRDIANHLGLAHEPSAVRFACCPTAAACASTTARWKSSTPPHCAAARAARAARPKMPPKRCRARPDMTFGITQET